jgi:hypothetical protein
VMRLLRVATAVVWLVVAACEVVPTHQATSQRRRPVVPDDVSSDPDLAFPGGGRILFLVSAAPGYGWGQVGVIDSDGRARHYARDPHAFPYWDPGSVDRLLMLPYGSDPTTRSFEIAGDTLREFDSWQTDVVSTHRWTGRRSPSRRSMRRGVPAPTCSDSSIVRRGGGGRSIRREWCRSGGHLIGSSWRHP